jgi:hypothetical protein
MRGGKRVGAGRTPGSPNKASRAREERIAAEGVTPLDYMIAVMRDDKQPTERRDEMAKAAAPYVHPRLASVESKNETTVNYVARVPVPSTDMAEWQKQHADPLNSQTLQ